MAGALAMVLEMNEERFAAVLMEESAFELDYDRDGHFGPSITLMCNGVERYRVHLEAVRDEH